ncbi:hypothetical protein KBC75_03745 [Candidatus Shapirobacteria bacterium]|nr:hypothetical protein [Candidatus Shapirobacteria bacterium]
MKKKYFRGFLLVFFLWMLLGQLLFNLDRLYGSFDKLPSFLILVVKFIVSTVTIVYFPIMFLIGWFGRFIDNGSGFNWMFLGVTINVVCFIYLLLVIKLFWYLGSKVLKIK